MLAKAWNDFSMPTRKHSCRSSSCASACLRCASGNRRFVLSCKRSLTRPTIGQPSCDWRRLSRRSSPACAVLLRRLMSQSASESYGSWSKTFWWGTTPSPFATASQSHLAPHKTAVCRQVGQTAKVTFCVRGVVSPLLANLFLHYGLDRWLQAKFPRVVFERFADDAIVHCRTEGEALAIRKAIAARLQNCGLELHPEKTTIVYCKDDDRRRTYQNEKFDFLGYTFRPRRSKNRKGKHFINFSPAVSDKAAQAMRDTIRSWNLPKRSDKAIDDLSRMFNPIVRGWLLYYGRYYRSALYPPMRQLDRDLALWAKRKYKRLRNHLRRAAHWIASISRRSPALFAHWQMGVRRGSVMGAV